MMKNAHNAYEEEIKTIMQDTAISRFYRPGLRAEFLRLVGRIFHKASWYDAGFIFADHRREIAEAKHRLNQPMAPCFPDHINCEFFTMAETCARPGDCECEYYDNANERGAKMHNRTMRQAMDELGVKIAAASDDSISWHGWIRGEREQERELRKLGVQGVMLYQLSNAHGGLFEQCLCDTPTMERLRKEYPLFWPGTFTGCDRNGDQLPREKQKYSKYV